MGPRMVARERFIRNGSVIVGLFFCAWLFFFLFCSLGARSVAPRVLQITLATAGGAEPRPYKVPARR